MCYSYDRILEKQLPVTPTKPCHEFIAFIPDLKRKRKVQSCDKTPIPSENKEVK